MFFWPFLFLFLDPNCFAKFLFSSFMNRPYSRMVKKGTRIFRVFDVLGNLPCWGSPERVKSTFLKLCFNESFLEIACCTVSEMMPRNRENIKITDSLLGLCNQSEPEMMPYATKSNFSGDSQEQYSPSHKNHQHENSRVSPSWARFITRKENQTNWRRVN